MITAPKSSNQCNEADAQAFRKQHPPATSPVSVLQSPVSSVGTPSSSSCHVASCGIDGRTTLGPIEQFRSAIRAAGLTPPDVIEADGKLHRFASNGKHCDDAGWYVLYLDAIPAGCFGDWRGGFTQTWRADIGCTPTSAEEDQYRAKMEAIRREREAEEVSRKTEARKKANRIWAKAEPCKEHSYLAAKRIKGNGATLYKGLLVIPMRAGSELHSLQFIDADGNKKFLTDGRVAGCYFSIGTPVGAPALCIAEGFATGATIHEATGYPVAVAFNAGNLEAVAKALREKFPDLPLILCADDDCGTSGNPGLTKATEAAQAAGGVLAIPDFGQERPDGATDFNDMAAHRGIQAVRQTIVTVVSSVIGEGPAEDDETGEDSQDDSQDKTDVNTTSSETEVSQVSEVQTSNGGLSAATPADPDEVSKVSGSSDLIPSLYSRPAFRVFEDWLEHGGKKLKPGVWHFGTDKDKPTETWVCSPLHVEAVTFDGQDRHFGRLLRFRNTLGRWCEWAMPMEMLRGAGDDLRGELLAMGVEINPTMGARHLLLNYLQAKPPKRRMQCALQVGWFDGSFVLPDAVIGPKASDVIFQSGECGHDEHTRAGTLVGWQKEISARAVGNPLLLLALSASFAGPMLALCKVEGGGLHFVGDSSTGKTTLLEAACSIWGGPNYRRSWRATANGMEGAAALFNDCLLALDEISECDPREVGAIVYALANGRGKQRAGRGGNARMLTRWNCLVLSSGELSIATTMQEGGHRVKAGQVVRLLDIPAARAFGAWDDLHGLPTGTAFSDAIKRSAATHHGHAGRAFLEKLTRDTRDFGARLERIKALPGFSAEKGEGQEKRAAGRFALIALAGELATEYGITGWPQGGAIKAAAEGFKAWQASRGRGNGERRQILERVLAFIERHGDARFSDADATGEMQTRDRAGWWRNSSEGRIYLFTSGGLREALKGFDFDRALDALQEAGALPPSGADGKRAKFRRIGGRRGWLYPIEANKLESDHGA